MSNKERFELKGDISGLVIDNKYIVYSGGALHMSDCTMSNCTVGVEGEAADGVNFMKKIFNAGMKCTVMKTFLTDDEYEIVKSALNWEGKDGN